MIQSLINWYSELLQGTSLSDGLIVFLENITIIGITVLLAWLADFLTKRIIIASITRIVKRTKNEWDDIFMERGVFNRLAHLAPALVVNGSLQFIFNAEKLVEFLGDITLTYMVLVVLLVVDAILNALMKFTEGCRCRKAGISRALYR